MEFMPKARGLMENREIPILHKYITLCGLRASNESRPVGRVGGEIELLNRLKVIIQELQIGNRKLQIDN